MTEHDRHKGQNAALKLTSCKIHEHLLEASKIEFVRNKLTMQKLINRALYLYINNVDFRNTINLTNALVTSGSL